jgi:Hemolysin-type calcium-binding repeat (2 copies).
MSQIIIPSPPHSTADGCGGLIITGSGELRPTTRPGIPRLNLTPLDDIAYGTNQDEELAALEGNDLVGGGGGSDVIQGNQGQDTLSGGEGDDTVMGAKQ